MFMVKNFSCAMVYGGGFGGSTLLYMSNPRGIVSLPRTECL